MRRSIKLIAALIILPGQALTQEQSQGLKGPQISSPLEDYNAFGTNSRQQVGQFAEAEAQVKYWDCSIAKSQAVIEGYQGQLRAISQKIAPILSSRDQIIADNLASLELVYGKQLDPDTDSTGDAIDRMGRLGAVFSRRLAQTLTAAAEALVLIKAAKGHFDISSLQHQIDLASIEFAHLRDQIAYRGSLLKGDWEKRDALVASWEERGVSFQRSFYGRPQDCNAQEYIFDGTWGSQTSSEAKYQIKGNTFRFLTPRQYKYTGYCTINYSEFTYTTPAAAEVQYNSVCPDGSQGNRGIVRLAAQNGEVLTSECSWEPEEQPGECLTPEQAGIALNRFNE